MHLARAQGIRRTAASWPFFVTLYAALTTWIIVGHELVPAAVFAGVKNGSYVVVMIVGIRVFRDAFARGWQTTRQHPLLTVGMVLAGLALMGVASAAGQAVVLLTGAAPSGQNQAAISAEALAASTSLAGGLLFVGLGGIVAPVVEELVFRELPFSRVRRVLTTPAAFILSGLVFAVIHLRSVDEWPLAILYFGFASALATAYLLSKRNLLVSIGVHVLWNGTGLAYLLFTAR